MAKSGIMRALRRAMRAASGSSDAEPTITRRSLLAATIAAGGAHLVGCGTAASNAGLSRRRPRGALPDAPVAVVGAGLAGLAATWSLQLAGVGAVLYEARKQPGGRVGTHRSNLAGGLRAELGGEFIDSNHAAIRKVCKALGLKLEDLRAAAKGLAPIYEVRGKTVSEAALIESLRPIAASLARDAALAGEIDVPHLASGGYADLDRTSVSEWLEKARCPSPAREIVEVAFTTELGLDPGELSSIPMLLMLQVPEAEKAAGKPEGKGDGKAAGEGDRKPAPPGDEGFALYGESDERWRIEGGNDRLVEALRMTVGRFEPEHALTAMKRDADGRVRLSFAGKPDVVAEHVVVTVPFSVLREVDLDASLGLDEKKARAIRELGYGTNAKHIVETIARPWTSAGKSGEIYTTRDLQCAWDGSRALPALGGLLTNFRGGRQGRRLDQVSTRDVVAELDAVSPGIRDVAKPNGIVAHWPSVPTAKGSYSTYRVGQLTAFGGVEGLPAKNVHFAGEHTSLDFPGFMEGAVASGLRAADEVIAAIGGR
jgi:monoamine oxidase